MTNCRDCGARVEQNPVGRPRAWCLQCRPRKGTLLSLRPKATSTKNYDYKKTLRCAACLQPMWKGTTSAPQGRAMCRPCRLANPRTATDTKTPCVDCGSASWGVRCKPCASIAQTIRSIEDPHTLRRQREKAAPGLNSTARSKLLAKWKRQARTCWFCPAPADTIDHVLALVRGGTNHEGNLIPCCRSCNASKSSCTIMEWRTGKRPQRMAAPKSAAA